MATIDLLPESGADAGALAAEVRELTARLERERVRNAGLEQGLGALTARIETLQRENEELRERLGERA